MSFTIVIPGKPARWQRPVEGVDGDGMAYRYNDKDAEKAKLRIREEAMRVFRGHHPLTGPVLLRVVAIFEIPKSWPIKLQRAAREARVMHVQDPDLDQIVKLAMDALRSVAYVDDNQVCGFPNSAKRYGGPERTEITVTALSQQDDEKTPGQRRLERRVEEEGWRAVLAPPARRQNTPKTDKADQALVRRRFARRSIGHGFRRGPPAGGDGRS